MKEIKQDKTKNKHDVRQSHGHKKTYVKPTIRSEQVFEAQALACEKCDVGGPTWSCPGIFSS